MPKHFKNLTTVFMRKKIRSLIRNIRWASGNQGNRRTTTFLRIKTEAKDDFFHLQLLWYKIEKQRAGNIFPKKKNRTLGIKKIIEKFLCQMLIKYTFFVHTFGLLSPEFKLRTLPN